MEKDSLKQQLTAVKIELEEIKLEERFLHLEVEEMKSAAALLTPRARDSDTGSPLKLYEDQMTTKLVASELLVTSLKADTKQYITQLEVMELELMLCKEEIAVEKVIPSSNELASWKDALELAQTTTMQVQAEYALKLKVSKEAAQEKEQARTELEGKVAELKAQLATIARETEQARDKTVVQLQMQVASLEAAAAQREQDLQVAAKAFSDLEQKMLALEHVANVQESLGSAATEKVRLVNLASCF